jgi:DNA-binding beta-propeller fold protein YncE
MKNSSSILIGWLRLTAWCCLGFLLIAGCASHPEAMLAVQKVPTLRPKVDETRPPGSQPAWEDTGKAVRVATIPVRGPVLGLDYGEGAVWVVGGKLARIDPDSNFVVAQFEEGGRSAVAAGEGSLWAVKFGLTAQDLLQLDPRTGRVLERVSGIPHHRGGPAVGEGSVWVHVGGKVLRIDPKTAKVVATIPTHGSLGSIAFGAGAVWALEQSHLWPNSENLLSRIDPSSNQVTKTIHIGSGAFSVAVGEGAVWVTQSEPDTASVPAPGKLLRIEPQSLRIVRAIPLWRRPGKVVIAAGSLWIGSFGGGVLMRVDPIVNQVTEMLLLPGECSFGSGLAVGAGALWAGQSRGLSSGRVCRIELSDFSSGESHTSQ